MNDVEQSELIRRTNAAVFKAIAGDKNLNVTYKSGECKIEGEEAVLDPPTYKIDRQKLAEFQGASDKLAIFHKYHNANLHRTLRPYKQEHAEIFDALEYARTQIVGTQYLQGAKSNIMDYHDKFYYEQGYQQLNIGDHQLNCALIHAHMLHKMGKFRISSPLNKAYMNQEKLIDGQLKNYEEKFKQALHNQKDFSQVIEDFLRDIYPDNHNNTSSDSDDHSDHDEKSHNHSADSHHDVQEQEQDSMPSDIDNIENGEGEHADEAEQSETDDMIKGDSNPTMESSEEGAESPPHIDHHLDDRVFDKDFYKIYTIEFDKIAHVEDICDNQEELEKLRRRMDEQMHHLGTIINKLANRLQRRLQAQQMRSWLFDQDDGMLDSAKLTRIIVDPFIPLAYKVEKETSFKDTVVFLLIDNSGSMRGRPISIASISADILTRTLERVGIKTEILGFTTSKWKGGNTRQKWTNDGKISSPGRLNDLLHIIYKKADEPYRRAKNKIAFMLRDGLLKENIDGEALLWAKNRLLMRPEERRILMVISDGAPVDDSTLGVNDGNYLERHLRAVIADIQQHTPIELTAIGIGHDVTRYYKNAMTIHDVEQLGKSMVDKLEHIFMV